MSNNQLNIVMDENNWTASLPEVESLAVQVFENVLAYVNTHEEIDFLAAERPININLSLSNDTTVQLLNHEFRNMDKPTNVLSFANIDDPDFDDYLQSNHEIELGDIIIALETMQREADLKHISLHDHFCHLFAHGVLHLLGFDHQKDEEAEYMESFETNILQQLNINNPYEEF